jgi:hypothetical protein
LVRQEVVVCWWRSWMCQSWMSDTSQMYL